MPEEPVDQLRVAHVRADRRQRDRVADRRLLAMPAGRPQQDHHEREYTKWGAGTYTFNRYRGYVKSRAEPKTAPMFCSELNETARHILVLVGFETDVITPYDSGGFQTIFPTRGALHKTVYVRPAPMNFLRHFQNSVFAFNVFIL